MSLVTELPKSYPLGVHEKFTPMDVEVARARYNLEGYYVGKSQPPESEHTNFALMNTWWWDLVNNEVKVFVGFDATNTQILWQLDPEAPKIVVALADDKVRGIKGGDPIGIIEQGVADDGEEIPTLDDLVLESRTRQRKSAS